MRSVGRAAAAGTLVLASPAHAGTGGQFWANVPVQGKLADDRLLWPDGPARFTDAANRP